MRDFFHPDYLQSFTSISHHHSIPLLLVNMLKLFLSQPTFKVLPLQIWNTISYTCISEIISPFCWFQQPANLGKSPRVSPEIHRNHRGERHPQLPWSLDESCPRPVELHGLCDQRQRCGGRRMATASLCADAGPLEKKCVGSWCHCWVTHDHQWQGTN